VVGSEEGNLAGLGSGRRVPLVGGSLEAPWILARVVPGPGRVVLEPLDAVRFMKRPRGRRFVPVVLERKSRGWRAGGREQGDGTPGDERRNRWRVADSSGGSPRQASCGREQSDRPAWAAWAAHWTDPTASSALTGGTACPCGPSNFPDSCFFQPCLRFDRRYRLLLWMAALRGWRGSPSPRSTPTVPGKRRGLGGFVSHAGARGPTHFTSLTRAIPVGRCRPRLEVGRDGIGMVANTAIDRPPADPAKLVSWAVRLDLGRATAALARQVDARLRGMNLRLPGERRPGREEPRGFAVRAAELARRRISRFRVGNPDDPSTRNPRTRSPGQG